VMMMMMMYHFMVKSRKTIYDMRQNMSYPYYFNEERYDTHLV
jgi:hypothetical protein